MLLQVALHHLARGGTGLSKQNRHRAKAVGRPHFARSGRFVSYEYKFVLHKDILFKSNVWFKRNKSDVDFVVGELLENLGFVGYIEADFYRRMDFYVRRQEVGRDVLARRHRTDA